MSEAIKGLDPQNPEDCELVGGILCQPDIPERPADPKVWYARAKQLRAADEDRLAAQNGFVSAEEMRKVLDEIAPDDGPLVGYAARRFVEGSKEQERKLREAVLGEQQPEPVSTDEPSAHDLVIADMAARKEFGLAKYGSLLQASNGRDNLQDAYEEVLDLAVYLRNEIQRRRVAAVDRQPTRQLDLKLDDLVRVLRIAEHGVSMRMGRISSPEQGRDTRDDHDFLDRVRSAMVDGGVIA